MPAQVVPLNIMQDLSKDKVSGKPEHLGVEKTTSLRQLAVTFLNLINFRCYERETLEVDRRPIIISGPNGTGKTNLLEALSFLTPGRGLRGAKLNEIARRSYEKLGQGVKWGVSAKVSVGNEAMGVGTGCENIEGVNNSSNRKERRIIKIDGVLLKKQSDLGKYISAQWLTPQMDRLFLEGASSRRRFFDQLISGLDSGHRGLITEYQYSVKSRNRLLKNNILDAKWLSPIEEVISRTGVAIAVRRIEAIGRLQKQVRKNIGAFPGAIIKVTGQIEGWLVSDPALLVEDRFLEALRNSREKDGNSGITSTGPHRSDFEVFHGNTEIEAANCSTGEQKSLLIGILLAFTRLQAEHGGFMPFLLLDEIMAHLDESRRRSLAELILDMGAQVWITGTDRKLLNVFEDQAQYLTVNDGKIIKSTEYS